MTAAATDPTSQDIAHIPGDGGPAALTDDELIRLKAEIDDISRCAASEVNDRRTMAEDVRWCRWEGQSADGLKHAEQLGKQPFPHENASDARVRLADLVCTENVLVTVAAALRTQVQVRGLKTTDGIFGSRLRVLRKWVIKNHLGSDYRRELTRLANWVQGDAPAGGILGVFWETEDCLKWQPVTLDDLPPLLQKALGFTPEQSIEVVTWILDPSIEDETAEWLRDQLENAGISLKKARVRKVIRELREKNESGFPMKYTKPGRPRLTALRLFEDIFFPANTTALKRARAIFHREWLSLAELEGRMASHGYSEKFVAKVKELAEGKTAFLQMETRGGVAGDGSVSVVERNPQDKFANRGLFEIVTAYYQGVTEDGARAIYTVPFSYYVDVAAKERELLELPFEGPPFVWFGRELLTQRLWDSRGVPELLMTEQGMAKFLTDSFRDATVLGTNPPILTRRNKPRSQLVLKPNGIIRTDRPDEVSYLQPPAYPIANDKMQVVLDRRVAETFGRRHESVPADLSRLHWQGMADQFLDSLADAEMMLLQLCQAYMDEEELKSITGDDGKSLFRNREEIAGKFHVELSFNTGALDMDWLVKMAEVMAKYVLPLDSLNVVQRDKLIAVLMSNIDANLADATLMPVQGAQQAEVKDEEDNLVRILNGIEPPMLKDGQNFGLRKQVLLGALQKNPEIGQKLTPLSREMLEARMKYLDFQTQQQQNAVIGRTGGQPVLGRQG